MTIGFLFDRFLPLSETFLLHEWRTLRAAGLPLQTYALERLAPERAACTPEELAAARLLDLSVGTLAYKSTYYLRHPVKGARLANGMLAAAATAKPAGLGHLWRANHVFALVRRLKPDGITHLHATFLGLPATLAWCAHRLTGIPYSISAHSRDVWAEDFGSAAKIAEADRVFVCNRAAADELIRRYPAHAAKIAMQPHGVPLETESAAAPAPAKPGRPADPPPIAWLTGARHKLLAVGRLVEKKGFEYLITACDVLQQHQLDFGLAIVGGGPLLQKLGAHIRERSLTNRVDLLGAQPAARVQELMRQADLLVVPSVIAPDEDRDGVPNVILEAFAAGLPVAATPVGGIPEVVIPETTGYLAVDFFPSALIQIIHQALEQSPQQRQALAINAKFWLQEHRDLSHCVQPLLEYFHSR